MSKLMTGLALAVGLVATAVLGQVESKPASDPGGPVDGSSPGPRGFRGGRGSGSQPDPSQFIDSMVRGFDTNGDGVITPDEVAKFDDRTSARFQTLMRQAGLDPKRPIKVTELRDALAQGAAQRGGRSSAFGGGPSSTFGGGPIGGSASGTVGRPGTMSLLRRPAEPPDPKSPMVAIQAVLVELVQDEPGAAGKGRPGSPAADAGPSVASQGKSELGLLDLDLGAPEETILAALRKLGVHGRLDILNRVQLTTLDKQPASLNYVRHESVIAGVSRSTFGTTRNTVQMPLGFLVGIEPRVAGDVVVVQVDVSESHLGRSDEGTVIFSSSDPSETIRHAPMIANLIQTVVKAPAGKTVVVAVKSESGRRRTETLLLVSARVLNVKAE